MPNIGLILSGGMLKGAYQLGALKCISEYLPESALQYASAASIGALNAYAFFTGQLKIGEDIWKSCGNDLGYSNIVHLMKETYINKILSQMYNQSQLHTNLYIPLLNISTHTLEYINLKNIRTKNILSYLKASVSLPPFIPATKISNFYYYDGAMIDNIPITPLMNHNIDYIICIYFDKNNYIFDNISFDKKIIRINFFDQTILRSSLYGDSKSIDFMIQTGYQKTQSLLSDIFKNGWTDLEYIHQRNNLINQQNCNITYKINGDIIVNRFNKIAKKFVTFS